MNQRACFSRRAKLTTPIEFKAVFSANVRFSQKGLTILAGINEKKHPRLGIAVPRKQIRRAVDRNRLKRQIREVFRTSQHDIKKRDYVVLIKAEIKKLTNQQLRDLLLVAWQKVSDKCEKS